MSNQKTIRIGTRGSPLAMVQTRTVIARVAEACPDVACEIVVITTSGDWKPEHGEVKLSEAEGGKGLFAKEIERALLDGEIDAAVHSMKDMDSHLPQGLVIEHMLPREDVRDAMLFSDEIRGANEFDQGKGLGVIPQGAVVGTASVRRAAFLLSKRPDLSIEPLRGNVQTRIEKVRKGQVGCTCLAMAGLNRLELDQEADLVFEPDEMLPAAGQGAVGIECRVDDDSVLSIFSQISDFNTVLCVKAERAALKVLDGSCHTPIGAYASLSNDEMHLRIHVSSLDGGQSFADEMREKVTSVEEAEAFGRALAMKMQPDIPAEIFQ